MQTISADEFAKRYGQDALNKFSPPANTRPTIGEAIANSFKGGVNQVKQGFQQFNQSTNPLNAVSNLVGGAGKIGSGAISAALSPLAPITDPLIATPIKAVANKIAENPTVQKFADSKAGQAVATGAENVANYAAIAGTVGGALETPKIGTAISTTGEKITTVGSKIASDLESGVAKTVSKIKGAPPTAESLAGKIVQGDAVDVTRAKNALSSIDTKGVKTYTDLSNVLQNKIADLGSKIDNGLLTRPESINFKDLTFNNHNYVGDALDQIENFYTKINDVPKLRQITTLKNKAETQGLTIKEINDLARLHGRELNAYNANGELASGLSKQAVENTRMGLKDTVRSYIDDPVFKAADKQLSDLINTKNLAENVAERANALQQKIQERGLLGKIGYGLGKAADLASGGGLKGLVNYFIPRGEGLKLLNALDLEKSLAQNLDLLQKLTGENITDNQIVDTLNSIIKEGSKQKLLDAPKPGTPNVRINVPINQPEKVITNSAEETAGVAKRVGGIGSRRKAPLKDGQISAPKVKRGSYINNKAYKVRELQRIIDETKAKP